MVESRELDEPARRWIVRIARRILLNKFHAHKRGAKRRGIPFELTFNEWLQIWKKSKRLLKRGKKSGNFVMARYNDCGPYAVGNVKIITVNKNGSEGNKGKPHNNPNPPLPTGTVRVRNTSQYGPIIWVKKDNKWVRKSVLDYEELKEKLREEYYPRIVSVTILANKYNLSRTTVHKIVREVHK